jgi:hypothetical protein
MASTLTTLGLVALNAGDLGLARRTLEQAAAIPLATSHQELAVRLALARAILALEESRFEDARSLALKAASISRAERMRDDEASAHEVMALIALASRNLRGARQEIQQAEKLLGGQDFLCRMSVGITAARILAASAKPEDLVMAQRTLGDLRDRSVGLRNTLLGFEARLALYEVEIARGKTSPGSAGPAALEEQARKMGLGLLARKAAALAAGGSAPSGIRSLGLMVR